MTLYHHACLLVRTAITLGVSHRLCKHFLFLLTGSNPLWQHALSFPAVEGADSFYNQLAGINSSYTPGDKLGTDIGTRKRVVTL